MPWWPHLPSPRPPSQAPNQTALLLPLPSCELVLKRHFLFSPSVAAQFPPFLHAAFSIPSLEGKCKKSIEDRIERKEEREEEEEEEKKRRPETCFAYFRNVYWEKNRTKPEEEQASCCTCSSSSSLAAALNYQPHKRILLRTPIALNEDDDDDGTTAAMSSPPGRGDEGRTMACTQHERERESNAWLSRLQRMNCRLRQRVVISVRPAGRPLPPRP